MFQSQQTPQVAHSQLQIKPTSSEEWHEYWQAKGFSWRTEPEIDVQRQEELSKRRDIVPDIKKGVYPFKNMKLSRADVEWLLATHENGRGPVDWSDESQRKRKGLDLRGANLQKENLQALPLACLIGGMSFEEVMPALLAKSRGEERIHLEGADLCYAHLEKARLRHGHLECADLYEAHLEDADLSLARLESAWLDKAYLRNADLHVAHLIAANLDEAHLEDANLSQAHAEGANLDRAHLEKADLNSIHLEKASLKETFLNNTDLRDAQLAGANLRGAHLEGTNLLETHFEGKRMQTDDLKRARKWFHGPRWRGMEDVINSSEEWEELQEEFPEELLPADLSGTFFDSATHLETAYLGDRKYGFVSLADVSWGDINLSIVNWAEIKMLGDERIAKQRKTSGDKRGGLAEYQCAVRANRQLAIALENQGLSEDAAHFAYRAKCLQRMVHWYKLGSVKWYDQRSKRRTLKSVGEGLTQFISILFSLLFSWFLLIIAGYGYRLKFCLFWYFFFILGFAIAYRVVEPHYFTFWTALGESVNVFHGRGASPGISQFMHPARFAGLTIGEAWIGLVIEVVFVATLIQRFFGK